VNRTDVASDDPSAGDASAARPRRNRRGRRRRGRRGKNPSAGQNRSAQNPSATTGDRSPASGAEKADGSGAAGRQPPKPGPRTAGGHRSDRPVPGPAKPGGAPADQRRNERKTPKPGPPARSNGPAPGRGPKPSDLAARTENQSGTPAAMPRTKRRSGSGGSGGNRRGDAPAQRPGQPQQRLRTVRETSAGGLVLSSLDAPFEEIEAVLIGRVDRRGRMMWSLPKGHIETGETAEQTAIREVAEETGVCGTIITELGKIDYWFVSEGRRIHKTVHHYLLRYAGGELSDADYEVAEVAWVPLAELPRRLTYSDERRLARAVEGVVDELRNDPDRLARSEAESIRTEPNDYEKAAAARNQRRNEPPPPPRPRRRKRRPRRSGGGGHAAGPSTGGDARGPGSAPPHSDRGSGDG